MKIIPMCPVNASVITAEIIETPIQAPEIELTEDQISNGICAVCWRTEKKEFSGADLKDRNNEPRFCNVTSRSFKKALEALKKEFTATTTMYQAMDILINAGVDCRSYCAMD